MTDEKFRPVLAANPWFAHLPQKTTDRLLSLCTERSLKDGQIIHAKGDPCDGLYCVLAGRIRVSNYTEDGKEFILTWLHPGAWFGEIGLFDGLSRTHFATAEQNAKVILLPRKQFHELLNEEPELYQHFIPLLCQRIRALFSLIDDSHFLSPKHQLVQRLLLLSNEFSAPVLDKTVSLHVSQESLALMLDTSRQTINKWLNELQDDGLIKLNYGEVKLCNLEALSRLVSVNN